MNVVSPAIISVRIVVPFALSLKKRSIVVVPPMKNKCDNEKKGETPPAGMRLNKVSPVIRTITPSTGGDMPQQCEECLDLQVPRGYGISPGDEHARPKFRSLVITVTQ